LNYVNTLSVSGTVNTGLGSTREAYADMIYWFQYSAIIDGHTTDRCLSLDGRTVKAGSAEYYLYSPPQHYNCRSRWVAITYDTTYKPRIWSIPKSIPATTDINNSQDLIRPYIQKGSPAIQILQDEVREREEKNKQYETEGKYQNRIDANNKRINQINKALKWKT
jgi:FtsZ-binding cell division protein ZapB